MIAIPAVDDCGSLHVGGQHHGAVSKAGARAQQPVEGAVLRQFVDPAERGNNRLPLFAVDALVLDDLQVLGATGAFVAEEHGGLAFDHHAITALCAQCNQKIPGSWHDVIAKLRRRLNKINRLRAAGGRSL
jgi:hypothetical protein